MSEINYCKLMGIFIGIEFNIKNDICILLLQENLLMGYIMNE